MMGSIFLRSSGAFKVILTFLSLTADAKEYCEHYYTLDEKYVPSVWCPTYCCGGAAYKYCCEECYKSVHKNESCHETTVDVDANAGNASEIVGGAVTGLFLLIVVVVLLVTYCDKKAKKGNLKNQHRRPQSKGSPNTLNLDCPTVVVIKGEDGTSKVIKPPKRIVAARNKSRDPGIPRRKSAEGVFSVKDTGFHHSRDVRRHSADAARLVGKDRKALLDVRRSAIKSNGGRTRPKENRMKPVIAPSSTKVTGSHSKPGRAHKIHRPPGPHNV